MNDYTPRTTIAYYIVRSHCPACIGWVFGWLGVPGFLAHTVVISSSEEETMVNVRSWSGGWSSIKLGPVSEPTSESLNSLARKFM